MDEEDLARQNHLFLVTQVPICMFGVSFQSALGRAHCLMKDIRADIRRVPGPDDFDQCSFETGYVAITAQAAAIVKENDVDPFEMASKLYRDFGADVDTGSVNDRIVVSVNGYDFVFSITDYETDDPERGWVNATEDPLAVPIEQTMHRRVVIDIAQ